MVEWALLETNVVKCKLGKKTKLREHLTEDLKPTHVMTVEKESVHWRFETYGKELEQLLCAF